MGTKLLAGACNGIFYVLDKSSQTPLWTYDIKQDGNQVGFHATPVVENGTVYVGTDYGAYFKFKNKEKVGHVYAFDFETGALKWKYRVDMGVGSNLVPDKQNIFFVTVRDEIFSLKKSNGKLNWSYKTKGTVPGLYPKATPIVENGTVLFGSGDGTIYILSKKTGKLKSKKSLGNGIYTSLESDKSAIYVATEDRVLYKLNKKDFSILSKYDLLGRPWSPPILHQDSVFVYSGKHLYCLDKDLKTVKWKSELPSELGARYPVITGDAIIVSSQDGHVCALNTQNGSLLWKYKLEGRIIGGITESNGIIYLGSREGKIFAIKI